MLRYTLQRYGNRVLILKALIQEWEKYYKHLEGYNFEGKGLFALFEKKNLYKFEYLYQPSTKKVGTFIL